MFTCFTFSWQRVCCQEIRSCLSPTSAPTRLSPSPSHTVLQLPWHLFCSSDLPAGLLGRAFQKTLPPGPLCQRTSHGSGPGFTVTSPGGLKELHTGTVICPYLLILGSSSGSLQHLSPSAAIFFISLWIDFSSAPKRICLRRAVVLPFLLTPVSPESWALPSASEVSINICGWNYWISSI